MRFGHQKIMKSVEAPVNGIPLPLLPLTTCRAQQGAHFIARPPPQFQNEGKKQEGGREERQLPCRLAKTKTDSFFDPRGIMQGRGRLEWQFNVS